jgi:cytochrome o ubiquinol oxidase operon protein cyoD
MSAASHAGPPEHAAAPDVHDLHDDEAPHGSMQGYLIGFGLSVILTAIPFWLVMAHVLKSPTATAFTVMAFGGAQIVVHVIYFLHMTPKAEGGWNMLALIFTLVLVTIALAGSMWVMYHLNNNMMPTSSMTAGGMSPESMSAGSMGMGDMPTGKMTGNSRVGGNNMGAGDIGGPKMAPPTSARDPRTMP